MLNSLFVISLFLTAVAPDIEGARPGVDVKRYRFEISVSDSSDVIHGKASVTVRFTDNVSSFFLDLGGDKDSEEGVQH